MSRRLFVFWTSPLVRDAVRLILDHPDISLVGSSSDYSLAGETIANLRPNIVLIEESEGLIHAPIIELLEKNSYEMRLLVVNLSDNTLKIFHRQSWILTKEKDLLDLVLS